MKLHIGCFDRVFEGWTNTDITPHIWIAHIPFAPSALYLLKRINKERYVQHKKGLFKRISYLNVTKPFPFADGSVDCVYSAHMLGNLSPEDACHCVNEVFRVLRKGGIFRIVLPDLDELVLSYDSSHPEIFLSNLFQSRQERMKNRHHWMYNFHSLNELLWKAGFGSIARRKFKQGRCPEVEIIDERPGGLFIEAVK